MIVADTSSPGENLFTIDVEGLKTAAAVVDREIPLDWLTGELSTCEYRVDPVSARVKATVEMLDDGVLVAGEIRVRVRTECGICLAQIYFDLEPGLSTYMFPRTTRGEGTESDELTPEDLERESFEGDTIVLDGLLRDAIMLELPMNPRCPDGCAEFEPVSTGPQEPQEIDPRLAPLASIKLSKE